MFPDPHPLDDRLGKMFFRQAPQQAGVYLMRDQQDRVLYVGKARNLRQRLNSYRLANPDRMPRRHLRLVRLVARIELQLCADESAALAREAALLRELKPRFNRAGVWPGKTKYLAWRPADAALEFATMDSPLSDWRQSGPLNSLALYLQATLARLVRLALQPDLPFHELPAGWLHGARRETMTISCPDGPGEIPALLEKYFWDQSDELLLWFAARLSQRCHPLEKAFLETEMETLKQFLGKMIRQAAKPD
jgi:predicted GIY-YIG superfamily endonuclease